MLNYFSSRATSPAPEDNVHESLDHQREMTRRGTLCHNSPQSEYIMFKIQSLIEKRIALLCFEMLVAPSTQHSEKHEIRKVFTAQH